MLSYRGEYSGSNLIDLQTGRYAIRRAAKIVDKSIIIGATKTRKSERADVLPAFALEALRRHRREQAARNLRNGIRSGLEAYVFDRPDGSVWNPNELSRAFSRMARGKKLPPLRLHDLRHGFATLAFAAGVPLKVVSESLGHASIAVTSSLYVRVLDEAKQEKSRRLDAYMGDTFRSGVSEA